VLPVFIDGDQVEAQVWGTQGLSDCPAAAWAALDPSAIQQQLGAVMVVMNGPRHWVIDGAVAFTLPTAEHRMFGDLEMQLLATVRFPISQLGNAPYTTRTVARDTSFTFFAGAEIYELIAPDGAIYVMQSYAQIVDPALTEAALPGLGARLAPPAGWRYQVRTPPRRPSLAADQRPSSRTSCRTPPVPRRRRRVSRRVSGPGQRRVSGVRPVLSETRTNPATPDSVRRDPAGLGLASSVL
jgi:hypothetical protein